MKRWIIIALLLAAAAKPAVKPAVKPYVPPKVPMIFLCSGENPLDISSAMLDIYQYMQENEKEKKRMGYEISNLQLELAALKKKVANR